MLRRGIIVVFVALALLLFDWESPSPDSTLVLDAFDALANKIPAAQREQAVRDGGSWRSHGIT